MEETRVQHRPSTIASETAPGHLAPHHDAALVVDPVTLGCETAVRTAAIVAQGDPSRDCAITSGIADGRS